MSPHLQEQSLGVTPVATLVPRNTVERLQYRQRISGTDEPGYVKRGRILVVDGDALVAAAIKRSLSRYYVDVADCVGAGLGRLDLRTYDLLILERRLPDGLGEDLIVEVRPRWPGLPILLMSGQLDRALSTRPPATRADDVIEKPLVMESLIAKIEHLLPPRL